jgi:hypothetical protein
MKVLYVGGYSRSGSTLLARILGESSQAICVGETRFLWSRGLHDNVDCGCGKAFRSCPFWTAIGEEAFGGWDRVDVARLVELDRATNPFRVLPLYRLPPRIETPTTRAIREYVTVLTRLYGAIARVSGASMIVEMSKDPNFACLLMKTPDIDLRILHLVRDSRAVAYSWMRHRRLSSPIDGQQFMPQFRPVNTAVKWLGWNLAFHALGSGRTPYRRIAYESFIAAPRATMCELNAFVDEDLLGRGTWLTETAVELGGHHIFSGNPMRERKGSLPIRLDEEWRRGMSWAQRATVTAVTWPLLCRYGYPMLPTASDGTTVDGGGS